MPSIIPDSIIVLLQAEIQREAYASNFYRAASIWTESMGYFGATKYLRKSSADELSHRDAFIQFLVDLDAPAYYPPVDQPPASWASLRDVFDSATALEMKVTQAINDIATTAMKVNAHNTFTFLQTWIAEQTSSLGELSNIRRLFDRFGADVCGLKLIDDQLGEMAQ